MKVKQLIVHTSGAADIGKLGVLSDENVMLGSLHPAFPFANTDVAVPSLENVTFAIESSHEKLQTWLEDIVESVGGQTILIPAGKKAQYHAALVFMSNYTVTLYAIAQELLKSLDAEPIASKNALMTLLSATVKNIAEQDIPAALTGPLTRVDTGTITAHLDALDDENLKSLYKDLARLSYPMLQQRGIDTTIIEQALTIRDQDQ